MISQDGISGLSTDASTKRITCFLTYGQGLFCGTMAGFPPKYDTGNTKESLERYEFYLPWYFVLIFFSLSSMQLQHGLNNI